MTPLGREIAELIRSEGPMPVSRYMALCLGHPKHGYYITRDPFGAAGDFTTAPEISQIFGELIGLWTASAWLSLGAPAPFRLVELGPGRGTLMADMLRAGRLVPGFREAARVHLVETSPVLRVAQGRALAGAAEPVWHDTVEAALDGPVIVIANEFLDALPLDQFVMTEQGWRERLVGLDGKGGLAFGLGGGDAPGPLAPPGTVLEQPLAALDVVATISRHLASAGGVALFVDYGSAATGFGDTLQAMARHGFADPLAAPGEADLTVHVDFARMAQAARGAGATAHGPVTQRDLLLALGLGPRAEALARKAAPEQAQAVLAGASRLVEEGETGMGELFKALALTAPGLPVPPGFEASGG